MPRVNRRTVHECPVNVDLPVDLVERLNAFLDQTGMKKKQVIELALTRFLQAEAAGRRRTA